VIGEAVCGAGETVFLSEDLQDGMTIVVMQVVNPF
jgi:predicted nucleic acid-binding protein